MFLIVADNHSEFSYLERFQSTGHHAEKASGNIVVEVIAKDGAKVKYSAVDQLGANCNDLYESSWLYYAGCLC